MSLPEFGPTTPAHYAPPKGAIADRGLIERAVGFTLPEALFACQPFGRRVIVIREPPPKRSKGGIEIPHEAQRAPAVGWVVAAGPRVGEPTSHPMGASPYGPLDLVGRRVQWGQGVGAAFFVTDEGLDDTVHGRGFGEAYGLPGTSSFRAPFVMLNDHDLWGEVP